MQQLAVSVSDARDRTQQVMAGLGNKHLSVRSRRWSDPEFGLDGCPSGNLLLDKPQWTSDRKIMSLGLRAFLGQSMT